MRHFLFAGALLLMHCAFLSAQIPDDYDMPPAKIKVKRPGFPYNFGDYGVAMDERQSTWMKCSAEGRPAPTYAWKKDGQPVNTSDPRISVVGGRLTIEEPSTADEGEYQCFASNEYGTALSPKYQTVYAYQKPFEDVDRKTFDFTEGDEAQIECGAPDGAPKPRIYWTYNDGSGRGDPKELKRDGRIAYTDDGALYFSNIVGDDAGGYYCFAANELVGSYQRSPAKVVSVEDGSGAQRAATITHLPPTVEGLRTQFITIRCLATGFPTPEISWFRENQEITPDDRVYFKNFNQDLYFDELSFEDGGVYECRASNSANQQPDSGTVLLTVVSAPYFSTEPMDVVIPPGGRDRIVCDAGGVPDPTLTWLENGQPMRSAEGSPYQVNDNAIDIIEPLEGQSTVFQCILDNDHGEKVGSYTITVLAIPATIKDPPEARVIESEGKVISLYCRAFGSPQPTFEWHKGDMKVTHGGRFIIEESEEEDGVVGSILNVIDLVFEDSGRYTCHALNSVGNDRASSTVLVRFPTNATMSPAELVVRSGESADFTCNVTSDKLATPTLTWFLDGRQIFPGRKRSDFSLLGSDTLHIERAKASHTGIFECLVETTYDNDTSTAQLIVQSKPDPPYNVEVEIVGLQATLSWVEPDANNAEISSYTIEWKTQHDTFPDPEDPTMAPWDIHKEISASSTTETIELGNHLEYSFRVIATNEVGISAYSGEVTGPMTPPAPPGENSMPSNVRSEANEPGKLTISWDEVHPYYHNAPDYAYVVRWKRPGDTEWQETVITDPSTTTFEIEGDEYEEIEYSVGVQNSEDAGPPPNTETATTGQGQPSAAPSNVQLVVMGANEINVTWDAVPEEDVNGVLSHYNIYYTMQAGQGSEMVQECDAAQTSCVVGGLEAFTSYEVSVSVVNELQEGPRSAPVTVKTAEGVPTPPENLEVESTSYRVAASWQPPAKENGVHRGYNITIIASRNDEFVSQSNMPITDKNQLTYKLDAEPEMEYEITVTAFTNAGDSDPAKASSTTAPGGVPPVPGQPELDNSGEKELNITWPPVKEGEPKPDEVRACYKQEDDDEDCKFTGWVDVLDEDIIHIAALEPGTKYAIYLEQRNKDGVAAGPTDDFETMGAGTIKGGGGALQPWFIAIICIIILLLLILLIICILKSQKGGKYNVSDKENQLKDENAPLKNNDGFAEFNNDSEFPDDMDGSQDSLASNPDDDGDSLREYADDEDPSKFNEEGSFIEEYHDPKPRSTDTREGGTSTFV